jgi:D-alanyl-D-alanine carboxypeptidase/D-alanyl-D-alanine-endopeptidase (penicillin-binding protein 4)
MRVSIPDATLYAQSLAKQQLKKLGIVLEGHMITGGSKPTVKAVETHESLPLNLLIRVMMKYSDDLIANALFKTAGGVYYHAQGTWERGIQAEKEVLGKALNLKPESMFIFDGSGESYYNAITPEQMMSLLVYIQKTPALAKVIIPSLPVNGADGTMVNRLRNYPAIVHAKTGTWRDVSALSGYVIKYNTLWAFSIFVNGMTPIERGDATQVDAWMMRVLPPVTHTTKAKSKSKTGKSK